MVSNMNCDCRMHLIVGGIISNAIGRVIHSFGDCTRAFGMDTSPHPGSMEYNFEAWKHESIDKINDALRYFSFIVNDLKQHTIHHREYTECYHEFINNFVQFVEQNIKSNAGMFRREYFIDTFEDAKDIFNKVNDFFNLHKAVLLEITQYKKCKNCGLSMFDKCQPKEDGE